MTSGALAAQVEALGTALSGLRRAVAPDQVWHAGDAEVLAVCRELSALRARTEAAYLSVVAEVDRRRATSGPLTGTGGGTSFGSTTEGVLRTAALVSAGQARRDVAAAHALHGRTTDRRSTVAAVLPGLAEQLGSGEITREHVDVAVRCLDRIPDHLRGRAPDGGSSPVSAGLVEATVRDVVVTFVSEVAGTGTARDLDRACRVILDRIDPDGRTRFDPAAWERRFLDMSTDSTGMLLGRFQLDATAGLALRAAIDAHSAPVATDDGVRDPRSARQRRADALVVVAETACAAAVPVRGEPARVVLHVTPDQLTAPRWPGGAASTADSGAGAAAVGWSGGTAWAEGGEAVARATARRVACDAVLQRLVAQPSAGPLELGREVRLASRSQRRALAARDRGCVVPGCGAPPGACDAHHVQHWVDGGPTDLSNLVLLCGAHHSAVHAGTWSVVVCPDGIPEVVPPRWVDPERRPRRLWHHMLDGAVVRAQAGRDPSAVNPSAVNPSAVNPRPERGTVESSSAGAPAAERDRTDAGRLRRRRPVHDGAGGLAVVITLRRGCREGPDGVRLPGDAGTAGAAGAKQAEPGARVAVGRSCVGPTEEHLAFLLDTG